MEKGKQMTNHTDILKASATILADRGRRYGSVEDTFDRASRLSTIMLGKDVSMYDIAMIMHCMKMARLNGSRTLDDNYVDGINYLSFAAQFSAISDHMGSTVEDDIVSLARKFAPRSADHGTLPQAILTTMPMPEPKSE